MKIKLSPKRTLENYAHRATVYGLFIGIAGLVIATFFSITTYRLSQNSFELSQSDTMQNSQLTKLGQLVEIQSKQLQDVNTEIGLLRQQLETINKHYLLVSKTAQGTQKAMSNRISKVFIRIDEIGNSTGDLSHPDDLKKTYPDTRTYYINNVKEILLDESDNTFLISQPLLYDRWLKMIQKCDATGSFLVSLSNGNEDMSDQKGRKEFNDFIDALYDFKMYNLKRVGVIAQPSFEQSLY